MVQGITRAAKVFVKPNLASIRYKGSAIAWTGIRRQKITNPKTTSQPQNFNFAKAYAQGRAIRT